MRRKELFLRYGCGIMFVLGVQTTAAFAQRVQLAWGPSATPSISYYGIYRATDLNAAFALVKKVQSTDSTFVDDETKRQPRYFYVATAIDRAGNESGFSNVVEAKIQVPTAVSWRTFSARAEDERAILEWSIAAASNSAGFEIQRREASAAEFRKIDFLKDGDRRGAEIYYRFVDEKLREGIYHYRLKQTTLAGEEQLSEIATIIIGLPEEFSLAQNHPNPFNPTTIISYRLPQRSPVELTVYDANGREIYKLVDELQEAGRYEVTWPGLNSAGTAAPSGTYYYRLRTANHSLFRKMALLK